MNMDWVLLQPQEEPAPPTSDLRPPASRTVTQGSLLFEAPRVALGYSSPSKLMQLDWVGGNHTLQQMASITGPSPLDPQTRQDGPEVSLSLIHI